MRGSPPLGRTPAAAARTAQRWLAAGRLLAGGPAAGRGLPAARPHGFAVLLAVALVLTALVAVGMGSASIAASDVAPVLLHRIAGIPLPEGLNPAHAVILWEIRIPRVLLAAMVGSALAVSGAAMQGLFQNPLANPYVLGVSSGAALGAAVAVVTGLSGAAGGLLGTVLAFAAAFATLAAVYAVALTGGRTPTMTLLMAGTAAGALLAAALTLLLLFHQESLEQVYYWLLGSFSGASWRRVVLLAPWLAGGLLTVYRRRRELNALLLGEEAAHHLGVEIERVKRQLLLASTVLAAAAVAASGTIGFVGLIVPHLVRLVIGPDHRALVPATAVGGAWFLLVADTVARTALAPTEIPVGAITALCGGPFFLGLLWRRKRGGLGL